MPIDTKTFEAGNKPIGRAGTGVKSTIIDFLVNNHDEGAHSPKEIMEELGIETPQQVYGAIKSLSEKGHIEKRQPEGETTYYVRLTEEGLKEHSK